MIYSKKENTSTSSCESKKCHFDKYYAYLQIGVISYFVYF